MNPYQDVFRRQRSHHPNVKLSSAEARIARLRKLKAALEKAAPRLREAIHADYGKSPAEVDITEIYPVYVEINHAIKNLKCWMRPRRVATPRGLVGTSSEVRAEPRGVVLVIGPWNYPFALVINPLVSAIAAGNCVVIKPSELTAHTSRFLAEFLTSLFPPEEVAVFEGDAQVTQKLLQLPFDHVFFTGSSRVGKIVMEAAAKHLTSVTLELGGKSPVIIDDSADLERAASRIAIGKFINAGQTCVAPDYVLVPEKRLERFLEAQKAAIARHYGATEAERRATRDYCRIINGRNFSRLRELLESAVRAGARVVTGGEHDEATRYLSPTVLAGVTHDSPIMKEEIFGPILPVLTYSSLSEVYSRLHAQGEEKPLALYVFSQSQRRTEEILRNTTAGGTCVNQAILHLANPNLPFGGTGHSGIGSYHGHYGFRAFSHERAVLRQGKIDTFRLLHPPYTPKVMKMIERVVRYLA